MSIAIAPRWFITRHAIGRMAEMELTRAEVIDVIEDPEVTYNSDPHRHKPGTMTAMKGGIAVAYHPEEHAIITVLWARPFERRDENVIHLA